MVRTARMFRILSEELDVILVIIDAIDFVELDVLVCNILVNVLNGFRKQPLLHA